jgi:hypothetical protein
MRAVVLPLPDGLKRHGSRRHREREALERRRSRREALATSEIRAAGRLKSSRERSHDAVVIGGGPGGSRGDRAIRTGQSILVLERRSSPVT